MIFYRGVLCYATSASWLCVSLEKQDFKVVSKVYVAIQVLCNAMGGGGRRVVSGYFSVTKVYGLGPTLLALRGVGALRNT